LKTPEHPETSDHPKKKLRYPKWRNPHQGENPETHPEKNRFLVPPVLEEITHILQMAVSW